MILYPKLSMAIMLFKIGNDGNHFLANELFRRLANQFLIVGKFGGRENIFRGARLHQETASAGRGLRQRRSGHGHSCTVLEVFRIGGGDQAAPAAVLSSPI